MPYTQAFIEPVAPFHAGSFEPAVSLTEALPQGADADILLLGCGDVRNIMYTCSAEQGMPERKLDITACDIDEFVIARNVLLFTILLDDNENILLRQIWNIYYNFHLDDSELQILETQAEKLVSLSYTLRDWHASPYGATLRFCDEATLALVHHIWAEYAEEACPTMRANHPHARAFWYALNTARTKQHDEHQATEQDVSRSCAPLAMEMAKDLLFTTHQHWEEGLVSTEPLPTSSDEEPGIPNPLFAAPILTFSALKWPTNPLLSFHLGAAQAKLTRSSFLYMDNKHEPFSEIQERIVKSAFTQFADWTDAFREAAPRTVIRFTACEAFALCYTLRFHQKAGATSCEFYRGKHGFDVFNLAQPEYYGETGKAPNQFDIIDTSTLSQSVSMLNLLVSAGPLLKDGPSSTLYTADLFTRREFNFKKLLHEQSTSISILLGLVPTEYWTNAMTVSPVDQLLTAWSDEAATRGDKDPSFRSRISWKQIKHIAGKQSLPTLHVQIPDLVNLVYTVNCNTFFGGSPPAWASSPEDTELLLDKHVPISLHQPATIGAFLSTIGDRSKTDPVLLWDKFLKTFVEHHITNRGAGDHVGAFIFEVPALPFGLAESLGPGARRAVAPPFSKWSATLRAVAITVVVPPECWTRLKALADVRADQSTQPALEISGHLSTNNAGGQGHRVTTVYSDLQISFGTPTTEGSRDHANFTVRVQEDEAGWNGTSPMIVSYYVPADFAEVLFGNGTVGITTIRLSTESAQLKQPMEIPKCDYETPLRDEDHVYITKTRPGQNFRAANEGSLRSLRGFRNRFSARDEAPEVPSDTIFTASFTELGDIITITGRINITSAKGRKLLTDKAPVQVEQASPFTLDVIIGNKVEGITIPLTFPAPVNRDSSRTRIARKSAYVEVIVPPAKPDTDPKVLDTFFLPTVNHVPGQPPATLNIPHLNLDALPILSLADNDKHGNGFITTLASLMFSPRERLQRGQPPHGAATSGTDNTATTGTATTSTGAPPSPPSARLNLKESLYTMFMLASGQQQGGPPQPTQIFALSLPDTGVHMLLFVGAVRLDGPHGSVVLDAAALPLTRALVEEEEEAPAQPGPGPGSPGPDAASFSGSESGSGSERDSDAETETAPRDGPLTAFLLGLRGHPRCTLSIDSGELALWKRTLPALAERCRTWMHRPGGACEYAAEGGTVPVALGDGEPVLCSCGCGELPDGFVDLPGWETAARYATRVAISPVYASGMVEEVVDPAVARAMAEGMDCGGGPRRCRNCRRPETGDVALKKCARCLEAAYCSAECQKMDWKKHRVRCEAAVARGEK
ncbi:hypothetical protein B0I37DRAFT_431407 [Chaetomium sp. MPI-CAGE-AT-0009]|nr:hypothetical protein B0I37DRAFT_431407 [Chaetomium sp. MPI-CAGE-AT-0009]